MAYHSFCRIKISQAVLDLIFSLYGKRGQWDEFYLLYTLYDRTIWLPWTSGSSWSMLNISRQKNFFNFARKFSYKCTIPFLFNTYINSIWWHRNLYENYSWFVLNILVYIFGLVSPNQFSSGISSKIIFGTHCTLFLHPYLIVIKEITFLNNFKNTLVKCTC